MRLQGYLAYIHGSCLCLNHAVEREWPSLGVYQSRRAGRESLRGARADVLLSLPCILGLLGGAPVIRFRLKAEDTVKVPQEPALLSSAYIIAL